MTPTAESNVLRHLAALRPGLEHSIIVIQDAAWNKDPSRIYAWPVGTTLYDFCSKWDADRPEVASVLHGKTEASFREPGGVPAAMQVCFKPVRLPWSLTPEYAGHPVYCELDHDYRSPLSGFKGLFVHAGEFAWNKVTRSKTNQAKIARMLDERFGATPA